MKLTVDINLNSTGEEISIPGPVSERRSRSPAPAPGP